MYMIKTWFSPNYYANNGSMSKLPAIAESIKNKGFAELVAPTANISETYKKLAKLHDADYVRAVMDGAGRLAASNELEWSTDLRDGVILMNAGMLEAAQDALARETITANLAQGFHHALPERGMGFCTFNGLALVAAQMPDKRIFVLDADEHQGNGTKAFVKRLPNLWNYTIYGTYFGGDGKVARNWDRKVGNWAQHQAALAEAFTRILDVNPDIILYQAGVDCFEKEISGVMLTEEQLRERDYNVFDFAHRMGYPLTFVAAGGYTPDRIRLHTNTWDMAKQVLDDEIIVF
jgi:acetoin utilization deacetylase AcuC-like enzyme